MMKKKVFMLVLLLLFSVFVKPKSTLTIRVGLYNNPPKIYIDKHGNPKGFWADITNYIAKQENWNLIWEYGTWQECLTRLKNNDLDIMVDVGVTPQRQKSFKFNNEPVLLSYVRLYKKKGALINSIFDLENKKIGALKCSFDLNGPEGLKITLKKFGITSQIVEMNSYKEIFEALQKKEIDAGIVDADYGNLNSSKYKIENTYIFFQPAQMKFAFPKNSAISNLLIQKIDYQLKNLKQDRNSIFYESLDKNLIGTKEKRIFPLKILLFLLVIILTLAVFTLILKYQVKRRTKLLKRDLIHLIKAEAQIKHLNNILLSIRNVNQLIAREKNRDKLIKKICENIIKYHGYKRAWIALFDNSGNLIAFSSAGMNNLENYLKNILATNEKPERLKKILNSNEIDIVDHPSVECKDCIIANNCKNEVLMAKRIETKNNSGIFCVSIANISIFSDEEKELFKNLSEDISFALSKSELELEKEKAEKQLYESEARYRAIVEQAFEGISLFDLQEHKLIDANQAYQEMLGYSLEELTKIDISKIVANPALMKEKINEVIKHKRVIVSECELIKKDGTILNSEISSRLINYQNKQIILSVIRDITEKKKMENELRKSEEKYRLLAQSIPDIVIVIDLDGKISYVNPNAIKISQLREDEILGQNFSKFIEPPFVKKSLEKLKTRKTGDKSINRYELILTNNKGLRKPYEVTSTPIMENGKITKVLLIGHDITDRKKKMELVKRSLEEKEILLKELYHRTKNNMQIISSMISIQARKYQDPKLKNSFMEIMNKIHAMALVHQKLYEAKSLSRINLKTYIKDLFILLKESFISDSSKIDYRLELEDCFITIDPALNIGLILNELITNIFKYGISKDNITKIFIGLKTNKDIVNLYIEDFGYLLDKDIDLRKSKSMGLRTVFSLVEYKLKGQINYTVENGLKWHIQFKITDGL